MLKQFSDFDPDQPPAGEEMSSATLCQAAGCSSQALTVDVQAKLQKAE